MWKDDVGAPARETASGAPTEFDFSTSRMTPMAPKGPSTWYG